MILHQLRNNDLSATNPGGWRDTKHNAATHASLWTLRFLKRDDVAHAYSLHPED
jgi:hypothetical protein